MSFESFIVFFFCYEIELVKSWDCVCTINELNIIFLFLLPDAISENQPRVIDDSRARKLAVDLKRCAYYETCATYGLNVERVFQDGKFPFYYFWKVFWYLLWFKRKLAKFHYAIYGLNVERVFQDSKFLFMKKVLVSLVWLKIISV